MRKILNQSNALFLQLLGRDRTEYFCSNTMNAVTKRLFPFLWRYDLQALVLSRRQDNPEVVSFELLPNQHWTEAQAGQYVEVRVEIDGETLERAYSISEICGDRIWITVKAQGKVSNWLHQQLKPGQRLFLRGPFGHFVYQKQAQILFLCAGSGITPCFSMLQDLMQQPEHLRPQIHFYAQFSDPEHSLFQTQLQEWQQAGLDLKIAYSRQPEAGDCPPLTRNTTHNTELSALFPDFHTAAIYLCGPEGFKTQILGALEQAQFPMEQLFIENFRPQQHQASALNILPEVYFSPFNYQLQMTEADRQKSLLELGLEHGLDLERGCRKGICGSCKLILKQGEVEGQTLGNVVYLCSAYPRSEKVVLGY